MLPAARQSVVSAKGAVRGFGLIDNIKDAMENGTGDYDDIDNGLSAGGSDGNGSPQSGGSSGSGSGKGLIDIIEDAMNNGTGDYEDIDNGFSAGGHDGNGSPQVDGSLVTIPENPKPHNPKHKDAGHSSGSSRSHGSAKKAWDYYEAPLAEKYHFGKATAYQEALANTAYRREMEDMRKAGLNPSVIYGSHSSSGANSNIYPREASSGRSGGSGGSGRRYGGRRTSNYVFSGGAYYGLMFAAGAITAAVTKNVGAGMAASGLVGTALKAINGFFKN